MILAPNRERRARYGCRNCEFRLKGDSAKSDGFHKCWGKLAEPAPHLFDLHQLYQLKTPENKQALLVDEKIREGRTSLFDVEEDELHGEHATRQRLQLQYQRSGKEWIDSQLGEEIAELLNSDRIIDQHAWVHRYHFHPQMSGRTSIKVCLPSVWKRNPSLHAHEYFKRYYLEKDGRILDPYKTLPATNLNGTPFEVREGCGAMQAYRELILGQGANCPKAMEAIATLLRNYVTLDTASQWIIFEHWCQRLGLRHPQSPSTSSPPSDESP